MSDDPPARAVHAPVEAGPSVADLAALPRDSEALSVSKDTAGLDRLGEFTGLRRLHARELPPGVIAPALARLSQLEALSIYGTKLASLEPLAHLPLRHLRLTWAHNLTSIAPIARLDRLEVLVVGDMKRVSDFSPIGVCASLRALHLEAGMWANQTVDSLGFLRSLTRLEELSTHYLKLGDGDLTPICALTQLKWLNLPTKYPVRDYARLSVCLPHTQCAQFGAHDTYRVGTLAAPDDPKAEDGFTFAEHAVLVGRPSTGFAMNDPKAAQLIARRKALFEAWQAHYRSLDDPASDRRERLD